MSARGFIDTNILVYAYDRHDPFSVPTETQWLASMVELDRLVEAERVSTEVCPLVKFP